MGSAANALIDRLPREESWLTGRSHCDRCGHELEARDLIPIVSYLTLLPKVRGVITKFQTPNKIQKKHNLKWYQAGCRYCGAPIPYRNLLVEIFMGAGYVLIFNLKFEIINQYQIINLLIISLTLWVTTIIAVMDAETKLVSEVMVAVWGLLVIMSQLFSIGFTIYDLRITNNILGLALAAGVIGGLWAVSRGRAMGFGDVEIVLVSGWWLGWPSMVAALWVAFVTGGVVGAWQLVTGKAKMKSEIAFGPFLIFGTWIGFLAGRQIIKYLFTGSL